MAQLQLSALALAAILVGCSKPTYACFGISDSEAVRTAQRQFDHLIERSSAGDAQKFRPLIPSMIQRDPYSRGEDGAVRVLFSDPKRGVAAGAAYVEIFEDCDIQWRQTASVEQGVNGGFPWRRLR